MNTQRWRMLLTLAFAVWITAGCETGTEPKDGPAFDAEAALEDYQALDAVLGSPTMDGFRALAQGVTLASFGEEVGFAAGVASELDLLRRPSGPRPFAARLAKLASGAGGVRSLNPIISSFRRGKTFVYDPSLGRYVMDPNAEGAPDTGVRFLLYEPGLGGKPDTEREIGYADLIDEGDGSPEEIALRLMVVRDEVTILDYRTTVDILTRGGKVTVDGYLQGEFDRLDFDIQVMGASDEDGDSVDISFEMGIATRDFLISGSVRGVDGDSGEGGEVSLLVRAGRDSFSIEASGSADDIEGTFRLNGELFATVVGNPDSPTIKGRDGGDLTWAETLVLRQILDSTEDVFDLFEDLMDPVDELVIIALIL
ncbi:MAG: hypothetical protein PVJ04_02320 [Gemmatimonadota bacterium]|jgi:hypothetical protein